MLAGSTSFLLGALHVGCVGGINALANALPGECCRLQSLYDGGDASAAEAADLQRRLVAPNLAVTRELGVAGLKRAMEWMGFYGGPCRKPLMPLTEEEEKKLKNAFTSTGFL